jgi:glycosyltransferase involved in cell wall biosynthesis
MTGGTLLPLVSVVIPTRDRTALLEQAVRSVLAQTYQELEVVIVDDGSAEQLELDSALAADPRVRVLRNATSAGAGAARNLGAAACSGPLLAFLDDDDTWRPAKLDRQVAALEVAGPLYDAVECGFELWDDERLAERYLPENGRDLTLTLLERPVLQPSTVLIRSAAFEALGGFNPDLKRVEDWELWVRFSDSYRAVTLPEVLVDRATSSPSDELPWYREMVRLLTPRIDLLPEPDRSRIRSVHLLVESHLLFREGDRRHARSLAISAWREYPPSRPRSALYVLRSVVGERFWGAGKHAVRRGAHPVLRRLGRDPVVRG